MKVKEDDFKNRSMIYEIEEEENPYKKLFIMRQWYKFLVITTMKEMHMLKDQLAMIKEHTEYMIKNLPKEEEYEKYIAERRRKEREDD